MQPFWLSFAVGLAVAAREIGAAPDDTCLRRDLLAVTFLRPEPHAHVPLHRSNGTLTLSATLGLAWRTSDHNGDECARGPTLLAQEALVLMVNDSPWTAWWARECTVSDLSAHPAFARRVPLGGAVARSSAWYRCEIVLTHVEPGPIFLQVETAAEIESVLGTDEGGRLTRAATDRVLIFADAVQYHSRLLERNPWMSPPAASSPFATTSTDLFSESYPSQGVHDPGELPRKRETSRSEMPVATILKNVAEGKEAWQQSTALNADASRAVDGRLACVFQEGSCSHTGSHDGLLGTDAPWWTVNLAAQHDIHYIHIFNRGDCCWDRLKGFQIILSNASTWLPDVDADAEAPATIQQQQGPRGVSCGTTEALVPGADVVVLCRGRAQYVSVLLEGPRRFLSLCEVQVWAESTPPSRTEAVVALADGYSLAQVMPFVLSLRHAGYAGGIHLFMSNLHSLCGNEDMLRLPFTECMAAAVRWLETQGVELEAWPTDLARPNTGHQYIPYLTDLMRLELYGRFAAGARKRGIELILLSDSRDVIFQRNPFLLLKQQQRALQRQQRQGESDRGLGEELHLFAESIFLDEEGHNRAWIEACWGKEEQMLPKYIMRNAVLCSGLVMASPEGVQRYASTLLTLFSESFLRAGARCLVGDQAMLNFAAYSDLLPSALRIWNNGELVWNLGTVDKFAPQVACLNGTCGWLVMSDSKVPAVLHQYTVEPGLSAVALHRIVERQAIIDAEAAAGAEGSGDAGGRFPADDEMRFGVPALMAALFPGVDAATIEILVMRAIGRFRQPA